MEIQEFSFPVFNSVPETNSMLSESLELNDWDGAKDFMAMLELSLIENPKMSVRQLRDQLSGIWGFKAKLRFYGNEPEKPKAKAPEKKPKPKPPVSMVGGSDLKKIGEKSRGNIST